MNRIAGKSRVSVSTKPLVSVITIVKNGEPTIRKTIESVINQTYQRIEYIVVDGKSSDRTMEIVSEYADNVDVCISERDNGPADGCNKGLRVAKGDIIFFLNADDWIPEDFLANGVGTLLLSQSDFVYGDMIVVSGQLKSYRYTGDENYGRSIAYTMPRINYPSVIFRKSCFERVGAFNTVYKVAPDYEFMLRLHRNGVHGKYCSRLLVYFRDSGNSNINEIAGIREVRKAAIAHGGNPALVCVFFAISIAKVLIRQLLIRVGAGGFYFGLKRLRNG